MPWLPQNYIAINKKVETCRRMHRLHPLQPGLILSTSVRDDDFPREELCLYKGYVHIRKTKKQRVNCLHIKDRYIAHDMLIQVCCETDAKDEVRYEIRDLWRREQEKVGRAFRLQSRSDTCGRREGRKAEPQTATHF